MSEYLLSTGMFEVDLVLQTTVHLADVQFGRLHTDHNSFLCDVQPHCRGADFGCMCENLVWYFCCYYSARWQKLSRLKQSENADEEREEEEHSLSQRGLNLGERAQADLLEGGEEAYTLA